LGSGAGGRPLLDTAHEGALRDYASALQTLAKDPGSSLSREHLLMQMAAVQVRCCVCVCVLGCGETINAGA
jgi:hypothetical protein